MAYRTGERTSSGTSGSRSRPAPFRPQMRRFISESRKLQTLYSNCEGSQGRRIVKQQDRNCLEEFICNAVYRSPKRSLSDEDGDIFTSVCKLANRISTISRRFATHGEIHFFVIWVHFYDYEKDSCGSVPVFKIFKHKTEDDAVFVDTSLMFHETWDSYLDYARFPESFLCVPRHGKYEFVGEEDILDLEFLCAQRPFSHAKKGFIPFCQRVIRSLVEKIKGMASEVKKKLKKLMNVLQDFCKKHKDTIIPVSLVIISVFVDYFACGRTDWRHTLTNVSSMLLSGSDVVNPIRAKLSAGENFCDLVSGFASNSLNAVSGIEGLSVEKEFQEFVKLLKAPKKDWEKMFSRFCSLFRKCRSYLCDIVDMFGPPQLKYLNMILNVLDSVFSSLLEPRLSADNKPQICDPGNFGITNVEWDGGNHPQLTFPRQTSVGEPRETPYEGEERQGSHEEVVGGKLLDNLSCLETDSPKRILNRLREVRRKEDPGTLASTTSTLIQVGDKRVVILLPVASLPRLYDVLSVILKPEMSIKGFGRSEFSVYGPEGNWWGTVYFPEEFLAVCLFFEPALKPGALDGLSRAEDTS